MENYFSLQTLMIKSSFCIHPHNDHSAINFLQNFRKLFIESQNTKSQKETK